MSSVNYHSDDALGGETLMYLISLQASEHGKLHVSKREQSESNLFRIYTSFALSKHIGLNHIELFRA